MPNDPTKSGVAQAIDATMERASAALAKGDHFGCERLCLRAVQSAWRGHDFERLARVCMPLQECRRLIRQQATDAAEGGRVFVLESASDFSARSGVGFYLVQPPMIGADARRLREMLWGRGVASLVMCREPMTQARRWPIVAVGAGRSYRVQVEPPAGVVWTGEGVNRDRVERPPTVAWFLATSEALGDAAFATIDAKLPAAWRVEDLLHALDALPEHEKLHQHLAEACRCASREPMPTQPRPRFGDSPHGI